MPAANLDGEQKDLALSEQQQDQIRVQDPGLTDQTQVEQNEPRQQRPMLQHMLHQDNKVARDADLASDQDIQAQTIGQRLDQRMRRKEPLPTAESLRHRLNNRRATHELVSRTVAPSAAESVTSSRRRSRRSPIDTGINHKTGATTPRIKGASTRPLVRIDEEGYHNKVSASNVSPLEDGRRHGYYNQTLIPPLERHSNARINDIFNTRSASVD